MALKDTWTTGESFTATNQNDTAKAINAVNLAGALTAPPSSSWTTSTLGSATFATDLDGRKLALPSVSGPALRVEYRTVTAPFTVTAFIEWSAINANYMEAGLFLRSSGGAYVQIGPQFDSASGGWTLDVSKFTSESAGNVHYSQTSLAQVGGMPNWYRIVDDNTNRLCQYSFNGIDWVTLLTVGRTDFLTPNAAGWGGWNSGGTAAVVRLRSWSVT